MPEGKPGGRLTRRLRFRLSGSYLAFFTVVFVLVGVGFRETLASIQERQNRQLLEERWGALRGYLRFRSSGPFWFYHSTRPEQASAVARIRHVFLLADAEGRILEISPDYRALGPESPEEIRRAIRSGRDEWTRRTDSRGVHYLVRSGVFTDRRNRRFYVAIGRSIRVHEAVLRRFTWNYFSFLPIIILTGGVFGWFLAGRALRPLNDVADASERITGSNLALRIPLRGAGDELDRLIDTFNNMMDRLEDSFRHIKQFSTDVSHELRTPITAVRGQLEVALFTAQTTEQYREAILSALEETDRLSRLVKVLLLLSQAESGQLALRKEWLDLSSLCRELIDQFTVLAEEANIKLRAELPPVSMAEVDRVQLERMLTNLLSNALKYTSAGGEVVVRLRSEKNFVELVVEDTGCGIAPDHLLHVFDRFYRVPTVAPAAENGLGLGLSFVDWIAKAHGGRIDVQSTLGKGSQFRVTLPVGKAPTPSLSPAAAPGRVETS